MTRKLPDKAMTKIKATRGLPGKVAEACGIDRHAVYQWDRVPVNRVHTVAVLIKMTPAQIRPDIFLPKKKRAKR